MFMLASAMERAAGQNTRRMMQSPSLPQHHMYLNPLSTNSSSVDASLFQSGRAMPSTSYALHELPTVSIKSR
jgi:hypothetical protein